VAAAQPPAVLSAIVEAFAAASGTLSELGAEAIVLCAGGAPAWTAWPAPAGVGHIHCMDRALFTALGQEPAVIVADRAMRFAGAVDADDATACVEDALALLRSLAREPSRAVRCLAPVLVRPGVFDEDLCRRLIARFEGGDHQEGAMASVDGDLAAINRVDPDKKHRRDLVLAGNDPLLAEATEALSQRLVPDIAKAFQAQAAHADRMLIARYDDTGGYFRRHRDNVSAHLAYREFAVSVNLNAGAFEGGALRFPEFDDHDYLPPTGAGLVFSASLLHEAAPVTRGSRYVFLTFLHTAAAEARRLRIA
jgi:predicted 2-oxoglutarate/Fe(II)-dependent dioxygenase YbiX